MQTFTVYVELGHHIGGPDGAWESSTSQQFETQINADNWVQAEKIALAQFGGPENCKVRVR
jgi:hypothetical protein